MKRGFLNSKKAKDRAVKAETPGPAKPQLLPPAAEAVSRMVFIKF